MAENDLLLGGGGAPESTQTGNQSDLGPDAGANTSPQSSDQPTGDIPGWHDRLPQDLKGNATLAKFKDQNEVYPAYIELERKLSEMGENSVTIPGEDASDEDWSRFYSKLGRPESIDGYEFEEVEGASLDTVSQWFKEQAFASRLDPKVANAIHKGILEKGVEALNQVRAAKVAEYEQGQAELKQEWGAEYKPNLEKARLGMKHIASPEFVELAKSTGISNHPEMARIFKKVYDRFAEDISPDPSDTPSPVPESGLVYKPMDL
jgi:hypothetical protein